eukprot:6183637-Pleurochrysis_carterae.AAC.1
MLATQVRLRCVCSGVWKSRGTPHDELRSRVNSQTFGGGAADVSDGDKVGECALRPRVKLVEGGRQQQVNSGGLKVLLAQRLARYALQVGGSEGCAHAREGNGGQGGSVETRKVREQRRREFGDVGWEDAFRPKRVVLR